MDSQERPCEPTMEQMWEQFVGEVYGDLDSDDIRAMRAVFMTGAASIFAYLFQNNTIPDKKYVKTLGDELEAYGKGLLEDSRQCDCARCTVERAALKRAPRMFRDE